MADKEKDKEKEEKKSTDFGKFLKKSSLRKKIKKKKEGETSLAEKINFGGKFR